MVSRAPLRRKSASGGARRPVPRAGAVHSVRWAAGRWHEGAGGGHRRSRTRPCRGGRSRAASPAQTHPDPARGARVGARGCALRCAARKRKLLAGPLARATSRRAARRGAAPGAPGDGERTRWVGSCAPCGASPAINSSTRGREDGASALRAPGLLSWAGTFPCAGVGGR